MRIMAEVKIVLHRDAARPESVLQAHVVAASAATLQKCVKACRESLHTWVTRYSCHLPCLPQLDSLMLLVGDTSEGQSQIFGA